MGRRRLAGRPPSSAADQLSKNARRVAELHRRVNCMCTWSIAIRRKPSEAPAAALSTVTTGGCDTSFTLTVASDCEPGAPTTTTRHSAPTGALRDTTPVSVASSIGAEAPLIRITIPPTATSLDPRRRLNSPGVGPLGGVGASEPPPHAHAASTSDMQRATNHRERAGLRMATHLLIGMVLSGALVAAWLRICFSNNVPAPRDMRATRSPMSNDPS
jgi:hypothetical protein